MKIAILITCFNRQDKTIRCLKRLYELTDIEKYEVGVFVVDGGSNDGTPTAIRDLFPKVHIEIHPGLYWAGGMRQAWKNALATNEYDFLWLVNDDTYLDKNSLNVLLSTHDYSIKKYGMGGIYTGCTKDPHSGKLTYGAKRLISPDRLKGVLMPPNGNVQECDLCNGNSLLVSREVFESIGGLYTKCTHGIADWEYSLRAKRRGFPVLMAPEFIGECERDHGKNWMSQGKSLKERLAYMNSPKGLSYKEFMIFTKEYFPKDYIPMKVIMWTKTLFPIIYDIIKR